MEVEFRREMNHTYMILKTTDQAVLESYETKILLNNRIPGLLPCSLQYLDNKTCFCYDVTSRQSLKNQAEGRTLKEQELRKLLGNILAAMSRMEEYLLSASHLILLPDQIFVAPDSLAVSLCFAPFYEEEVKEGLLHLTDFLMTHTGSSSQEAVILGSRFSHVLRQPNIRLTDLERALYGSLPGLGNENPASSQAGFKRVSYGNSFTGTPERPPSDLEKFHMPDRRRFLSGNGHNSAPGRRTISEAVSGVSFACGRGAFSDSGREALCEGKSANRRQENGGQKHAINGYILIAVASGLVLVGEIYVFLHYYNGKLPPWPVTAAGAALAAAAIAAVALAARRALRRTPENIGGVDSEDEKEEFDFISPYMAAYGEDVWGSAGQAGAAHLFDPPEEECPVGGIDATVLLSQEKKDGTRAYLVPEKNSGLAGRLPLEGKRIRIGKLAECVDICLNAQSVSRLHAEIVCREDNYYIRDLNSLNGTAVNEELLTGKDERVLKDGDLLRLADQRFIFHFDKGAGE